MVDRKQKGNVMCYHCKKDPTSKTDGNNKEYYDYPTYSNGTFIRAYPAPNREFFLMDSFRDAVCCLNYCPWCGRNLFEDNAKTEVKTIDMKNITAYAIGYSEVPKHGGDDFNDLFDAGFENIKEVKEEMEARKGDFDNNMYCHTYALVPVSTYRLVTRWDEV